MPNTKLPRPTINPGRQKEIKFKDEKMKKMLGNIGKLMSKAPRKKDAKATGRKKFKKGGFPDLSGDGKTTMKDILIGRGVIKKEGGSKMRTGKMGGGMMKKRMKRGGMAKKKRVKKAVGGGIAMGIKALKRRLAEKKGKRGGGQDASTMKPSGPGKPGRATPPGMKRKPKMMGGGMMKKRMKRGGRAMKRGGGMMKRPMMKRGGKAK